MEAWLGTIILLAKSHIKSLQFQVPFDLNFPKKVYCYYSRRYYKPFFDQKRTWDFLPSRENDLISIFRNRSNKKYTYNTLFPFVEVRLFVSDLYLVKSDFSSLQSLSQSRKKRSWFSFLEFPRRSLTGLNWKSLICLEAWNFWEGSLEIITLLT